MTCPAQITVLGFGSVSCGRPDGHEGAERMHEGHMSGKWERVFWVSGQRVISPPGSWRRRA